MTACAFWPSGPLDKLQHRLSFRTPSGTELRTRSSSSQCEYKTGGEQHAMQRQNKGNDKSKNKNPDKEKP
jgi:hypothetical protein